MTGDVRAWADAPVALLRLDVDGAVLDANRAFLRWVGRTHDEVAGRVRLSELLAVGGRIYWETHLSPLLHMQGWVDEVAVDLVDRAGARRPVLLTARVADDDGVPGVDVAMSSAHDRSLYERELLAARSAADAATERLGALQTMTAALSGAQDVGDVVEALLSTAVDHLDADGAQVWLVGRRGVLESRGARGTAPTTLTVTDTDTAEVRPDGSATVPLRTPARLHGVLVLVPRTGPADGPWDVEVLTAAGRQAGLALERALLFDQSATVAHELQRALLTTHVPPDGRVTVATEYRPGVQAMDVGGDWYDAFTVGDDVLAVVVGDVVGRGLPAATTMGQVRSAVRAAAGPGTGPGEVLERLDVFVDQAGVGFMTTVAYAEVALGTGVVRYALAGHLPPLRLAGDGSAQFLWEGRSTPLGVHVRERHAGNGSRPAGTVQLAADDLLVLYTDGLVERRDRSLPDGLDHLARAATVLRAPGGTVQALVSEAVNGSSGERDDVCVLVVGWHPAAATGAPDSPARLR